MRVRGRGMEGGARGEGERRGGTVSEGEGEREVHVVVRVRRKRV